MFGSDGAAQPKCQFDNVLECGFGSLNFLWIGAVEHQERVHVPVPGMADGR